MNVSRGESPKKVYWNKRPTSTELRSDLPFRASHGRISREAECNAALLELKYEPNITQTLKNMLAQPVNIEFCRDWHNGPLANLFLH